MHCGKKKVRNNCCVTSVKRNAVRNAVTSIHGIWTCKKVTYITVIAHNSFLMEKEWDYIGLWIISVSEKLQTRPFYIRYQVKIYGFAICVLIWWHYNTARGGIFEVHKHNAVLVHQEASLLGQKSSNSATYFCYRNRRIHFKGFYHRLHLNEQEEKLNNAYLWNLVKEYSSFIFL